MFKKSLLVTVVTISSFAQIPKEINQLESLDIKMLIQESINEVEKNQNIKAGGWFIHDRKKSNTGESFITILTAPKMDTNRSKENNITIDETYEKYKELAGLSIYNDINYTKDSFNAISTLISFPQNTNMSGDDLLLAKKIIDTKTFVINSNYNTNNGRYFGVLKDINLSIPDKVNIVTKNIQINGYYDQDNLTKQQSKFSIDSINIMPLTADLLGEYIKMKNLQVISETKANGENLNLIYTISMDLLDMHIDKEHSKIEKANLSMSIGNLNLKAYEELLKFLQENRENLENLEKMEELQILILELFAKSKNMYIEISDLSLSSLTIEGKEMGPVKITSKVSLKGTKELIQIIAVNPEFALTALSMEAKIELHKEILKEIYKEDKSVGSLAFLFAKYKNESLIYDATYKEGKLIINDQLFTNNSLQNLNIEKYAPRVKSTSNDQHKKRKEVDSNNTKKHTVKLNSKHVEKYEQNALHQAVLSKNFDEVKKILENTSDIDLADKLGRTPLHYAAFNGDLKSAQLLLEKGADINALDNSKQWTPLFFAVFMKHEDMANLLIKEGADQTLKDKFDRTVDTYRNQK